MSDTNQQGVQITEQNAKELLAKEALIIKDLQKKLYIIKNALIEEKKKDNIIRTTFIRDEIANKAIRRRDNS